MGRFNPNNYKSTDYTNEIDQVRSDLEFDHPNARVFNSLANDGSPSVRCNPISLVAPDSQAYVVNCRFELPGRVFGNHEYEGVVFPESSLEYGGKFGPGWTSQSDGAQESSGSRGNKRLEWRRKDGGTKKRTKSTIDAANWMKDLDGELYLSAFMIPGTHDCHALVGTPLIPDHANKLDLTTKAISLVVDGFAKATKAAKCQDWNIATQLQNGVRYLDFRYGDDLRMHHGQMELPGPLPKCQKLMSDFLDAHPQETVIVMAEWDKWAFITNEEFHEPHQFKQLPIRHSPT